MLEQQTLAQHHAAAFNHVRGPNLPYHTLADPSQWPLGHPVGN